MYIPLLLALDVGHDPGGERHEILLVHDITYFSLFYFLSFLYVLYTT